MARVYRYEKVLRFYRLLIKYLLLYFQHEYYGAAEPPVRSSFIGILTGTDYLPFTSLQCILYILCRHNLLNRTFCIQLLCFLYGEPPLFPHKQLFSITSANDIRPNVTKNLLNSLCQIIDIRSIQLLDKQLT